MLLPVGIVPDRTPCPRISIAEALRDRKKSTKIKLMTSLPPRGNQNLGDRVKVLLADDSVTMHRAVRLALKNEPFEVITCDNGQDALRLCLEHHPKIVLADLDMPIMTGPELTVAIKKNAQLSDVKVVLLCGSFDQVDESRLGSVPADGRIWKPFEAHALVAMLKTLLHNAHSPHSVRESAAPTGSLPAAPSPVVNKITTSQEITSPDLAKDLMEETFKFAEKASTEEVTRQSIEPTSLGLSSSTLKSKEATAPEATVRPFAKNEQAFGMDDDLQKSSTKEEAIENLWSDDFKFEQTPDSEPSEPLEALQPMEFSTGQDDFEIVTSGLDLSQPELPPSELPSSEEFAPSASVDVGTYNPTQSFESLEPLQTGSPTLVSEDEWVKDRDFSDYQISSSIQEHHVEGTLDATDPSDSAEVENPVSQEELKRMIQQELQVSIKGWLKELLQEELSKVLSEIERD